MLLKVNLLEKEIRAKVIKEYLNYFGINECVCFTCGNAAKHLKKVGLDVISVGENEDIKPNKWFKEEEIIKTFKRFNATSGYLNLYLMNKIADNLKEKLGKLKYKEYEIPTGSGETIICLMLAYPDIRFIPVRFNTPETRFDPECPLNRLLDLLLLRYERAP